MNMIWRISLVVAVTVGVMSMGTVTILSAEPLQKKKAKTNLGAGKMGASVIGNDYDAKVSAKTNLGAGKIGASVIGNDYDAKVGAKTKGSSVNPVSPVNTQKIKASSATGQVSEPGKLENKMKQGMMKQGMGK